MDNLEKKLREALDVQKRIEDSLKFLEDNSENLTESQLEDLAKIAIKLDESLFPEVDKIKQQMEENKQSIFNEAQNSNSGNESNKSNKQ